MNADADDRELARMAMPGQTEDDPDVSPLLADLSGLPPVWITASTNEVLLDDSLLLIRALGRAGVPVEVHLIAELFHMWTLWPDLLPQARDTLSRAGAFLGTHARPAS